MKDEVKTVEWGWLVVRRRDVWQAFGPGHEDLGSFHSPGAAEEKVRRVIAERKALKQRKEKQGRDAWFEMIARQLDAPEFEAEDDWAVVKLIRPLDAPGTERYGFVDPDLRITGVFASPQEAHDAMLAEMDRHAAPTP